MKKFNLICTVSLMALSGLSYSASAREHSDRFGLGYSTIGFTPLLNSSVTGIYEWGENKIHAFFTIPQTSPASVAGTALFKHTLIQSSVVGFHIGGGLGLASINSNFAFNLLGVAGFHFDIPGLPHVSVHLDGGPSYVFLNTPVSTSSFQISPFSPTFGASILYMF